MYRHSNTKTNQRKYSIIILSFVMIAVSLAGFLAGIAAMVNSSYAFESADSYMTESSVEKLDSLTAESRVGWDEDWASQYGFGQNFAGGNGSASSPWLISNPAQLARMAWNINHNNGHGRNGHYRLTANLNMSARRWDPIGRIEYSRYFTGVFDGGGFVISGISARTHYRRNNGRLSGFFGTIGGNATIRNLILNNTSIEATAHAEGGWISNGGGHSMGVVAAYVVDRPNAHVVFENIEVNSARVIIPPRTQPGFDIGGILGAQGHDYDHNGTGLVETWGARNTVTIRNSVVRNSFLMSDVSNTGRGRGSLSASSIGGLVGAARRVNIHNSSFIGGDIAANGAINQLGVGGIVGVAHSGHVSRANRVSLTHVNVTGRFNISSSHRIGLGGIVGMHGDSHTSLSIDNASSEAILSATATNNQNNYMVSVGGIGGLIGNDSASATINTDVRNLEYEGSISIQNTSTGSQRTLAAGGLFGNVHFRAVRVLNSATNATINVNGSGIHNLGGIVGRANGAVQGTSLSLGQITAIGSISSQGTNASNIGGAFGFAGQSGIALSGVQTAMVGAQNRLFSNGTGTNVIVTDSWQSTLIAPIITLQPQANVSVVVGQSPVLTVSAGSIGATFSRSYQWFSNTVNSTTGGTPILGQTNPQMTIATTTPGTFFFYVRVTNTLLGTQMHTLSGVSAVVVAPPAVPAPTISEQPQSISVELGQTYGVALRVNAANIGIQPGLNGVVSFRWFQTVNSTNNIDGIAVDVSTHPTANTSTFIPPTNRYGTFFYYAVATNTLTDGRSSSVASQVATVTISAIGTPIITFQPESINLIQGDVHTLQVGANVEGTFDGASLLYQWYQSNSQNNVGTQIAGATMPSLQVNTNVAGTVFYTVVVTNRFVHNGDVIESAVRSNVAAVVVGAIEVQEPTFVVSPVDTSGAVGQELVVEVEVLQVEGFTTRYQWFVTDYASNVGGTPIPGATDRVFTFTPTEVESVYLYVEVTFEHPLNPNAGTHVSNVIAFVVTPPIAPTADTNWFASNWQWFLLALGSLVLLIVFFIIVKKSLAQKQSKTHVSKVYSEYYNKEKRTKAYSNNRTYGNYNSYSNNNSSYRRRDL